MYQIDQINAYKIFQVQEIGKVEPRRPGRPRGPGRPGRPRRPGRPPKRGRPGRPPKYPRGMSLEQQAQRQRNRLKEVRSVCYTNVCWVCVFSRRSDQHSACIFGSLCSDFSLLHLWFILLHMLSHHVTSEYNAGVHGISIMFLQYCHILVDSVEFKSPLVKKKKKASV